MYFIYTIIILLFCYLLFDYIYLNRIQKIPVGVFLTLLVFKILYDFNFLQIKEETKSISMTEVKSLIEDSRT